MTIRENITFLSALWSNISSTSSYSPTGLKRRLPTLLVACLCLFSISLSHAGKMYKWVDANGNISYQDRPPPKNAKILQEREISASGKSTQVTNPVANDAVPVIVYTLDNCGRCTEVIAWLTARGVPSQARSLQEDRDAQRQILDLSNGLTVPTLFIDDRIITDTSEDAMLAALSQAGYTLILPDTTGASSNDNEDEDENESEDDLDQSLFDDEPLDQLNDRDTSGELDRFIDE